MTGSQRIEWRRRWPQQALSNFGWYGAVAVLGVACVWLLFGGESDQLESGAENPLSIVPPAVTVLAALGALVMAVPVLLRPEVAADHYALLVRSGPGRRLALPWAAVAEVAVVTEDHERYLLVRCAHDTGVPCDWPGWLEQAPLRRLRRTGSTGDWSHFDLAVPMRDFIGGGEAQLAALAAFAPDTVLIAGDTN